MEVELKRNKPGKHLRFTILGEPVSKQSARFKVATKNGKPVQTLTKSGKKRYKLHKYQEQEKINDEAYVKWTITGQLPFGFKLFTGPIFVTKLHHIFYPPKNLVKRVEDGELIYKATRPDLSDNLNKLIFDSMQMIVFKDDSQIVSMNDIKKYYGLAPQINIELEER